MVSGKHKSRSMRRVFVRTPGGKTKIQYKIRNPKSLKCSDCGVALKGLPRLVSSKFRNLSKSQKTVARPYGGNLCSRCMRKNIISQVRQV